MLSLGLWSLAPKPNSLEHVFAAGLPMGGLISWQALFDHAHLCGQDTILIHGTAENIVSHCNSPEGLMRMLLLYLHQRKSNF